MIGRRADIIGRDLVSLPVWQAWQTFSAIMLQVCYNHESDFSRRRRLLTEIGLPFAAAVIG
jgi:hypothetical protein